MMHSILAVVFVLVTASFYDGITRDLSEESGFLEIIGESDDEEIDSEIKENWLRGFSLYAITGCRPGDYSYDCSEKRKWDNVLDKPDQLFDYFYAKDKKKFTYYLARLIQEKVQYRQFSRWEQSIKHRALRRLICVKLIGFLRLINNDYLKSLFLGETKESLLKYAIRFVFYEKNKKYIDQISLIGDIYQQIIHPVNGETVLDLSFTINKHFQSLLMHAHELFQVFFKKDIQVLTLYKCNLVVVPDFNMPYLRELWLFKNKLKRVPEFKLPHLLILDLVFNDLKSVPEFTLNNLKKLKLSYNKLETIPNFDLPSLEYLDLAHNRLIDLPELILPKLKALDIFGNRWLNISKQQSDCLLDNCPKLENISY